MKTLTVAIVGNPNCGKTTLLNALTGTSQKVGNWAGVTVECQQGVFEYNGTQIRLVDLPGIRQLSLTSTDQGLDERIANNFLLEQKIDIVINVLDAIHLERQLFLTQQLLQLQIPLVIAVNRMDIAYRRHINLDLVAFEERLGHPVVGMIADKGEGLLALQHRLVTLLERPKGHAYKTIYPSHLSEAMEALQSEVIHVLPHLASRAEWISQALLQCKNVTHVEMPASLLQYAKKLQTKVEAATNEALDVLFCGVLYNHAQTIAEHVYTSTPQLKRTLTDRIDRIALHRFWGIPIFLSMMYAMFFFTIKIGGFFQDFFNRASETIFVQGTANVLHHLHAPDWMITLFSAGFGRGMNTLISFLPVMGCLFFFLAVLEASGYMARASFVIDRVMRFLGLPGKSFIPLIMGLGCNVPAISAARTLDHPRDRMLTILMSPFMSCGARLAIFAVFTAAFFPMHGENIVFALYLIGILAAVLTGFILRKTLLKGDITPLLLELPTYHLPKLKAVCSQSWRQVKGFIFGAGKLIVPICMLLGALNAMTLKQHNTSLASGIGRTITPIFAPMGIQNENWPAAVGLLTGILAKEVVIGTLNTLYDEQATSQNKHHPVKYERFGGATAAFAYLLFILLYFPCVSVVAIVSKELSPKWAAFSVIWSTSFAYGVATTFYQIATFMKHPFYSLSWLLTVMACATSSILLLRHFGLHQNDNTTKTYTFKHSRSQHCTSKCFKCIPSCGSSSP